MSEISIIAAVIALLLFLVNVLNWLMDRSRSWYFMPRSRGAQGIVVLIAAVVVALWFAVRQGLVTGSTYMTIVFCWFALMQVAALLKDRRKF